MSEILESLVKVAPILSRGLIFDCMIGVTDTEKFLAYYPSRSLNLGINVGDRLREGSINYAAIHEGKKVVRKIPRDVYGVTYVAMGYPIYENGRLVGCLSTGVSIEQEERLHRMAEDMAEALHNLVATTEQIAKDSERLAYSSQKVNESAVKVREKIAETAKLNELIQNVSRQTTILGLNAAIESARAGLAGKGFAIVAGEIKQLSATTSKSAANISNVMNEMNQLIASVSAEMEQNMDFSLHQATSIQELYGVIQQLQLMTDNLRQLAETIITKE